MLVDLDRHIMEVITQADGAMGIIIGIAGRIDINNCIIFNKSLNLKP